MCCGQVAAARNCGAGREFDGLPTFRLRTSALVVAAALVGRQSLAEDVLIATNDVGR